MLYKVKATILTTNTITSEIKLPTLLTKQYIVFIRSTLWHINKTALRQLYDVSPAPAINTSTLYSTATKRIPQRPVLHFFSTSFQLARFIPDSDSNTFAYLLLLLSPHRHRSRCRRSFWPPHKIAKAKTTTLLAAAAATKRPSRCIAVA